MYLQRETNASKYRKNIKNNQFSKRKDLKGEKAKKALEKSANFEKIAKVTIIFLATLKHIIATGKHMLKLANIARIARITKLAKEKTWSL